MLKVENLERLVGVFDDDLSLDKASVFLSGSTTYLKVGT